MEEHLETLPLEALPQEAPTEQVVGFFEKFKQWWHNTGIMDRLRASKHTLLEIGVYTLAGFILGFVIKRYLKYILLLVLFVVALIIMQQFGLMHIELNGDKIGQLFNVSALAQPGEQTSLMHVYWQWVKANVALVAGATVGFFIGLNIG